MGRNKAPLAMMEQAFSVLLFSIAAAVCLQAFVFAGTSGVTLEEKDAAMSVAEVVAGAVRAQDPVPLKRYGINFEPGTGFEKQPVRDGRSAEELGLSASVTYDPDTGSRYLWKAKVEVFSKDGALAASYSVAGQVGVQEE